jgi:hypothetical protein
VHRFSALLVFVQQLAHLLNRKRTIFTVKRLLTFPLIEEGPVSGESTAACCFVSLRRIADTARSSS